MNGAAVAPWTEEIMMRMWRQASSQYRNEQARQRREAKRSEDAARARVAGMSFHWTNESGEGVCDGAHEWFDLCAEALASVAGMQVGDRRVLPGSATIVRVA